MRLDSRPGLRSLTRERRAPRRIDRPYPEGYGTALGEFHGIAEQIEQYLPQLVPVCRYHVRHRRPRLVRKYQSGLSRAHPGDIGDGREKFVQFECRMLELEPPRFDFCEIQYLADEHEQVIAAMLDGLDAAQ